MRSGAGERLHEPSSSSRTLDTRQVQVDKTLALGSLKGSGKSMPSPGAATEASKGHQMVTANDMEPQGLFNISVNALYKSSPMVFYTAVCARLVSLTSGTSSRTSPTFSQTQIRKHSPNRMPGMPPTRVSLSKG
jgi:hypothetical protein